MLIKAPRGTSGTFLESTAVAEGNSKRSIPISPSPPPYYQLLQLKLHRQEVVLNAQITARDRPGQRKFWWICKFLDFRIFCNNPIPPWFQTKFQLTSVLSRTSGSISGCWHPNPPPRLFNPTTMPYFLLLKLLLWLFVRDEGEIFGKAERLEAPDDLQKIKNRSWVRVENKESFQKGVRVSVKLN